MKTHNLIISSTRPELLAKQITAFLNVKNGRRLNFYVFNDDATKNNKFLIEIASLKQIIPEANIYYFNIDEQVRIIQEVASKYSNMLNIDKERIYSCFKEDSKLYGIRSIQNKSVFIFYLNNKDVGSIIHRLDDDIFPYEADRHDANVSIVIKHDFFEKKETSINDDIKIISGNNYTIDSPSPLVNYADVTEFLFNFYNIAKNKSADTRIGNDILKISPSGVRNVHDSLKVLDVLPVNEDFTYKKVVTALERYTKLVKKGSSRIIINDNKENYNGINKFFPGGCVSFMYENFPTLTPTFGNQDLLWELIEILEGKTLVTDGYIGHIKSLTGRVSIVDDLKDSSYKHQSSITYSVFKYLIEKNNSASGLFSFHTNFVELMNKWLSESKYYSDQIIKTLDDKNHWYADESKFISTAIVKKLCLDFVSNYEKIKANFSHSTKNIDILMFDYYQNKKIFDKLLKKIVTR